MIRLSFLFILFLAHACFSHAQQTTDSSGSEKKKFPFYFEGALIYEYNLVNPIVSSSGIETRTSLFYNNGGKLSVGLALDTRIIPGIIGRKDKGLTDFFYPSVAVYNGNDSLVLGHFGKVLNKEDHLHFNGYIKGGIGLALNYNLNSVHSVRMMPGILFKQFRTEGNDTLSNPYGDPGHFWLETGVGYSMRIEYMLDLGRKKFTGDAYLKFLVGCGAEMFYYDRLEYNYIPLVKTLDMVIKDNNRFMIYNAYVGFALSRR